jgi:hypothetical protein
MNRWWTKRQTSNCNTAWQQKVSGLAAMSHTVFERYGSLSFGAKMCEQASVRKWREVVRGRWGAENVAAACTALSKNIHHESYSPFRTLVALGSLIHPVLPWICDVSLRTTPFRLILGFPTGLVLWNLESFRFPFIQHDPPIPVF